MKKLSKILLPMATALATAGAIVPMVSCKQKVDKWDKAIDLMFYDHEVEPLKPASETESKITEAEATAFVFGSKEALKIAKDDIAQTLSYETNQFAWLIALAKEFGIDWIGDILTAKCIISDLQVNYESKDSNKLKLSGNIELKAETVMKDKEERTLGKYVLEVDYHITNLDYEFVWTKEDKEWGVPGHFSTWLNKNTLIADSSWKVVRNWKSQSVYNNEKKDETVEDTAIYNAAALKDAQKGDEAYENLKMVCWSSFYLKNFSKAE